MSLGDTTYPDPLVPLQETGTGMALLYAGAGGLLAAMLAKGSKKARVQTIAAGTAAGGVLSVLMRPMRGRKVWHKKIRPRPYIRAGAELEAAGWGALERGRGRVRVAARYAAQLPLMDPLYNLREAAKELLLLEDHLGHPQKHCPDCIRKHLLTTEALLEEAVRLDTEGEMLGLLSPLPAQVRELWTAYQDGRPEHEIGQAARVLRKGLVEASAAVRVAARKGPPMQMGSAAMLKRQGLIPVDVFFGEARPHKRPIIELGDGLQDRRGNLHFFVGVDERGKAILADTMDKAKRLHRKVIQDRKHHTTAKNVAARFQLKQAKPEKALSKMGPRKAMLPEQVTDERDHDVRRDDPEDGGGSVLPGSEEEE